MVPQGPPNPLGGGQPVPPSLLRSNSGHLGGQGPGMPSQNAFPSLVSPRNQFNNLNMLGNNNVSSLLHQSFGNGGPGSSHHGLVDGGPDSIVGNGMGFTTPTTSYLSAPVTTNQTPSSQVQGQQHQFANTSGMLTAGHQQQIQKQLDSQNFQHNNSSNQQQQQFQGMRPGLGPVKLEQQTSANEQASQQQFQALRSMGSVKMEAQQMQSMGGMGTVKMESQQIPSMRGLGPVKLEPQHSDPSLFLQQQQQQLIRQSSQAAAAAQILHQQRLIQMQHQQQQQQLLKAMPQQRSPIQQQQQQFQQQNLSIRFVASARQLAKALEVPLVNDLGYTKRYVRCLQISEVVNSMKDLIDYSRETGSGPMESLKKFPRRTNPSPAFQGQSHSQQQEAAQLHQQQQAMGQTAQTSNNDNPIQPTSANNTTVHSAGPTTPSTGTIANLLHQNSMNSRPTQNSIPGPNNTSYGGNTVQMPSPGGSSCTMPQANPTPSPFHSPTPSSSNNNNNNNNNNPRPVASTVNSPNIPGQQQSLLSNDANDANDPQSSVQKIIHDMMMSSSQMGLGSMGNDMKNNVNGVLSSGSGGNVLMGSGVGNGGGMGVSGFGGMQNGPGQSVLVNGIRAALGNNNGRVGIGREQGIMNPQQQDMSSSQLLAGLGAVNGFNNLQFDWKTSP
ncbi:Transcriptional corepressor SEUSS [Striga hermonthica]|uniref:Transcriptional corepressor SEUSS n=1 Tax=Striga hermonthica TaxID=68872 RepID=A0A9N7R3K6_STRHE|nr:Transcriptional corepressor SEUSS [Striga hermonthica]